MSRAPTRLPIVLGAASLLTLAWAMRSPTTTVDEPEPTTASPTSAVAASSYSSDARGLAARASDPANAGVEALLAPGEDDPEAQLHADPWETTEPDVRIRFGRAQLEDALAALQDPQLTAREHADLRLRAAGALTMLRAELGATEDGREQLLAYAERLRSIPRPERLPTETIDSNEEEPIQ